MKGFAFLDYVKTINTEGLTPTDMAIRDLSRFILDGISYAIESTDSLSFKKQNHNNHFKEIIKTIIILNPLYLQHLILLIIIIIMHLIIRIIQIIL